MPRKNSQNNKGWANLPIIVACIFIVWAAFWLFWNAAKFSVTSDEFVYGPVGVRMLLKGDMIMNNEHPPLNKILAGLFVLPSRPNLEKAYIAVPENDQWKFGDAFLFKSGNSTDLTMFLSRMPTVLLALAMIISVWLWVSGYLGSWAGAGAAASLALNPNILANGALTTNDLHLAAVAWFLFVATFNLIKEPKKSRYIWFGLAIGLVLIAKFSGVFFIAVAGVAGLIGLITKKIGAKKIIIAVLISIIFAMALVWASYMAIEWRGILGRRTLTVSVPTKGDVEISSRLMKIAIVPFLRYKEGYNVVASHNVLGHNAYLDGKFSMDGFRSFFSYAIWYKTPTALIFLAIAGLLWAAIRKQKVIFALGLVGIGLVFAANYSRIHIGIRHVLPVYALFAPLVGFMVQELIENKYKKITVALLVVFLLWWGLDLGFNSPNKISYFSQISGGWREGYRHLSDSNTDWGQELQVIVGWARSHPDRKLIIGYPTGEDPVHRGVEHVRMSNLGTQALCGGLKDNETVLLSVNIAVGLFGPYPCVSDKINKADRLGSVFLILQPDDFKKP